MFGKIGKAIKHGAKKAAHKAVKVAAKTVIKKAVKSTAAGILVEASGLDKKVGDFAKKKAKELLKDNEEQVDRINQASKDDVILLAKDIEEIFERLGKVEIALRKKK